MRFRRAGYIDDEIDIERNGDKDEDYAKHGTAMVTGLRRCHCPAIW